jgi:DNA-binding response OmpR family regulator
MGNKMQTSRGIIRSKNSETVALCQDIGRQIGMIMTIKQEVANFLLDLQENDYQVAIFDCNQDGYDCLKWVKFIRRWRPKIPLIVLCNEIDKNAGAQMYEEGILYLGLRPLDREILLSVFTAVLKQSS